MSPSTYKTCLNQIRRLPLEEQRKLAAAIMFPESDSEWDKACISVCDARHKKLKAGTDTIVDVNDSLKRLKKQLPGSHNA